MFDAMEWLNENGMTTISREMLAEYTEDHVTVKQIRQYLDECERFDEKPDIEWLRRLMEVRT